MRSTLNLTLSLIADIVCWFTLTAVLVYYDSNIFASIVGATGIVYVGHAVYQYWRILKKRAVEEPPA